MARPRVPGKKDFGQRFTNKTETNAGSGLELKTNKDMGR